MVLGLLSVMTLLIGAAVASSQTLRFSTASITQMGNSVYYNESAMNRTIWLLMNDRTLFPDRSLKPENMQLIHRERFRADGMEHFIRSGDITLEVRIFDMNSGINISGFNPASAFSYLNQVISKKENLRNHWITLKIVCWIILTLMICCVAGVWRKQITNR